jgi:hypothetical protein
MAVIMTAEAILKRNGSVYLVVYWLFFIPMLFISIEFPFKAMLAYLIYSPFPIIFLVSHKRATESKKNLPAHTSPDKYKM